MPSLESNVSSKIFYASIRSHIRFIPRITADLINMMKCYCTKMKFPVKDFFSKYDQIRSFLLIWPHLLKKSLMENFIFCAVPIHMLLILMKEQGCEGTRLISLLKKNFEKKL